MAQGAGVPKGHALSGQHPQEYASHMVAYFVYSLFAQE
jgi:hypothetical protein